MTINYNVTGAERKRLTDCIARFLGCEAQYQYAPTFAYQAGYIQISKDGAITFDDRADSEEIETLLEELEQAGFHAETVAADSEDSAQSEELPDGSKDGPQGETAGLTVAIPLDKVNCGNLTSILDAKGFLIRKALAVPATPIEITEDTVKFPWFAELPDTNTAQAYTHFISALCEMSVSQKRIAAREKAVDNEKYAFRCFLLRLGFIGAEFKAERKILLRNLTGSSAFKNGGRNAK